MSRMFRRENPNSAPPREAGRVTTAGAGKQQRGWQADEPDEQLRSVWGAHRTAKIVLCVIFLLACVGVAVYLFASMSG